MSDRIKGFVVTLRRDLHEDDAKRLAEAIRMLAHVVDVQPVVAKFEDHIVLERARAEFRDAIDRAISGVTKTR